MTTTRTILGVSVRTTETPGRTDLHAQDGRFLGFVAQRNGLLHAFGPWQRDRGVYTHWRDAVRAVVRADSTRSVPGRGTGACTPIGGMPSAR